MAPKTAPCSKSVEASCPSQQWVIHNLSALDEDLWLPEFMVDGVAWRVLLRPCHDLKSQCEDNNFPGVYLDCETTASLPLKAKFSACIVDQKDPDKSVTNDFVWNFTAQSPTRGWKEPVLTEKMSPGLTMDDTLVLQTCVRVSKDLDFGSVDGSLIEESQKFLMRSCMRLFKGKRTSKPDVMLELGDDRLPAHRALLAESSDYFKAMFESGMSESRSKVVEIQEVAAEDMKIILDFIYGVLDTLPDERLQTLVLAADRLQVTQLRERCVTQLKLRLTLDNLAETAVLADRLNHHGLHTALVKFAQQEEEGPAPARHMALLKRALVDSPDFAYKLVQDMQSTIKKARKD